MRCSRCPRSGSRSPRPSAHSLPRSCRCRRTPASIHCFAPRCASCAEASPDHPTKFAQDEVRARARALRTLWVGAHARARGAGITPSARPSTSPQRTTRSPEPSLEGVHRGSDKHRAPGISRAARRIGPPRGGPAGPALRFDPGSAVLPTNRPPTWGTCRDARSGPQLAPDHQTQAAPRLVDRADLVVDQAGRQRDVADRLLGHVGRELRRLLRPRDP